jgi:hypothetical protein
VLVDFEKLEDPPHWPGAVRDREDPAVAPRVLDGVYHQTDAARVDERQLVEVQQHGLTPLARRNEARRDRIDRGDVELSLAERRFAYPDAGQNRREGAPHCQLDRRRRSRTAQRAPWRPSAAARQTFGDVEYFICSPNVSANVTGDPRRYIGVS